MGRYLTEFEQLLLFAVLGLGDEAYSAAIQDEIERRAGRSRSAGSIHTALERLENSGHVESWFGEPTPERGGRRKRFYGVTPGGATALKGAWDGLQRIAQPGLVRLEELLEAERGNA